MSPCLKNTGWVPNRVDTDQMQHSAEFDLVYSVCTGLCVQILATGYPERLFYAWHFILTLVLLNKLMPRPLLIFSQSDYLVQVVDTNSNTEQLTVQIQISWLLNFFRSQLIWIYTVCKGRLYPGSAGQGLNENKLFWLTISDQKP